MNILTELNSLLTTLQISVETGVFSGIPPDEYIVLTPLADTFALHGDNCPHAEIQEVRLSFFSKGNYIAAKNQLVKILLQADFTITDRKYIGHENDTGYYHYTIDLAKEYFLERRDYLGTNRT